MLDLHSGLLYSVLMSAKRKMLRLQVTLAAPQVALMRAQQLLFGITVSEQLRRAIDEVYGTEQHRGSAADVSTASSGDNQLASVNL